MSERERFDEVFPIPENSDIEWHESRQQYLTSTPMWKITAKGRTDCLVGWQARADLAAAQIAELENALMEREWQPIETAPRDGTKILGWCNHEADPYFLGDGRRLTAYGANAEGLSYVDDGVNIIEWHGLIDEEGYTIPAWWCLADGYGEVAANPTHWMPLPEPPKDKLDAQQQEKPDG